MNLQSRIDDAGIREITHLLGIISLEGRFSYNWIVEKFDEDRDRREGVHWDLKVHSLQDQYSFRVQLKTTLKTPPKIKVQHIKDWLSFNVDTILVVYFLNTGMAYWTSPHQLFSKNNIDANSWYTFNESDFKLLNVDNKQELFDHLKFMRGFKKKETPNLDIYPSYHGDFAISKVNIQTYPIEKFILTHCKSCNKYFNVEKKFYKDFFQEVIGLVNKTKTFWGFKKSVFVCFSKHFNLLTGLEEKLIKEFLEKWVNEIYYWANKVRLSPFAYYNLQQIICYEKDGDWKLGKWTHGSLWTLLSLCKYYEETLLTTQLFRILNSDTDMEIINSASYLLRHIKLDIKNTFDLHCNFITNRLYTSLDYDFASLKLLEYHIHYAASMQGLKESTDWLKEIVSDSEFRAEMQQFNLMHAADSPSQFIRSMTKKANDPGDQEKAIISVSKIVLSDYLKGLNDTGKKRWHY